MAINWVGFFAVILAVVLFQFTYKRGLQLSFGRRALGLAVGTLLSLPAIWFTLYYFHFLPEPVWFYELRALRGSELLVVFLGVFGGFLASMLPRLLRTVPLFLVIGCGAAPFLKPIFRPLDRDVLRDRWQGDVCLQSTGSTCGAASTATVLKYFGIETTEKDVAKSAYTAGSGTEAWYLARFIRSQGLQANFVEGNGLDENIGFPAITGASIGVGHFIPILSFDKENGFTIADPLRKRETLRRRELEKRYDFTGVYLSVSEKS